MVARLAKVTRVVVDIEPAQRQGLDVVDDDCRDNQPCSLAALAKPVGTSQPAEPLTLASSAA